MCVCLKCIGGNGSLMLKDYLGSSAYYVSLRATGGGGSKPNMKKDDEMGGGLPKYDVPAKKRFGV